MFPSPTGVTYYELRIYLNGKRISKKSFRPQQGLPIMNGWVKANTNKYYNVSVPNRGYLL